MLVIHHRMGLMSFISKDATLTIKLNQALLGIMI